MPPQTRSHHATHAQFVKSAIQGRVCNTSALQRNSKHPSSKQAFLPLLLLLVLCTSAVLLPHTAHADNTGPVGHWTFDGPDVTTTVTDRSGQNNHGYFNGGATSSAKVAGHLGQALNFDGDDDYTNITDNAVFDLVASNSYTWSFWVKPDDFEEWNAVWVQDITLCDKPEVAIDVHSSGHPDFGPVTNGVAVGWITTEFVDDLYVHTTDNVLTTSTWGHVLVTYDGSLAQASRIKTYVDGVDRTDTGDVSSAGTIGNISPTNIRIGNDGCAGENFDGVMDDVRVYNRALTTAEIQQLYKLGTVIIRP